MDVEKNMSRISYSQLSMFSECPLRWKLNYIDDLSISEPSIHLLFGTAMHEVIQEFVKDTWGKDLRVFVVNNKVVGCMMRQSTDDDFRANLSRGGEGFPYEVNEQIEWLSSESSKALDLDIAGVDLLFQNGGYKICEVNSNPGFEGMENYTKKNIAGEIVSFIKLKLG